MDMSQHAAAVDARLASGRQALAALLTRWIDRNQLTYRQIDALCLAASGRGIPPATIVRIRRAACDATVSWQPQPSTIVALAETNALVAGMSSGQTPVPPSLRPDWATQLEPMYRLDGHPLEALDICRLLIGEEGIIEPPVTSIPDRDRVERLVPVLGEVIERAIFNAGRSPRRDLGELLSHYPAFQERDLVRRIVDGDAYFTPEQLYLALPGLAYALTQFTGEGWSRERLLNSASDSATPSR